jgi:murein hydrolase activator
MSLVLRGQEIDRARTEALTRRATERLQALQQEADRLATQEGTLLGDLRKLEVQRQIKAEELKRTVADSLQVMDDLSANRQRMQDLEQQDSIGRPELRARLINMYKLGRGRYLRLLLSTSDLHQVGQASRILSMLAKTDGERIISRRHTLDELGKARLALEQRSRRLNTLRVEAEHAQASLIRAAETRANLILDIDSRRDLNAQLLGELQVAQQKLQAQLRDLSASAVSAEPATLPLRPFRGDLDWPVTGTLSRRPGRAFGQASSNGIEIAAAEGSSVTAVHDGVVAFADTFGGFGNLVILDHGSQSFSLYGNLLEVSVKKGDHIERASQVGTVGPAPAGPPQLYFELRIDGQSVDPLQWLKKR